MDGLGEARFAVDQGGAVERCEQPLVGVDDEGVGPLEAGEAISHGRREQRGGAAGSSGASAAANIPAAQPAGGGGQSETSTSASGRTEETTNYEISHTTRTEITEPGAVKRLSVAVAVDGVTTFGPKGKSDYTPRSADEMKRIDELVRSAVGFTATRGDQVSVVNVRFDHEDDPGGASAGAPLFNFDKNDLMRSGELVVLLAMAAMVVFFVVRPLLTTAGGGGGGAAGGLAMPMMLASASPGARALASPAQSEANYSSNEPDAPDRIDIAKIEGQVKASSVKRVSEFVESHPEESVSILRAWLH